LNYNVHYDNSGSAVPPPCWKPDCGRRRLKRMAPIDLISSLVSDELTRRSERLLDRRRKQAAFRDPHKSLDNFDFNFNPEMNRSLVFDLATGAFIGKREDALFSAQANRCPRITPDNAICYYSPFP